MPFKSKAQRRKFAHLLVEGKITDEQFEEWNRATGRNDLPERVHPKKTSTKKRTSAARPTKTATSKMAKTTKTRKRR